jgi:hypothetical protein
MVPASRRVGRLVAITVVAIVAAACGGGEDVTAVTTVTASPVPTATSVPTPTPTPGPQLAEGERPGDGRGLTAATPTASAPPDPKPTSTAAAPAATAVTGAPDACVILDMTLQTVYPGRFEAGFGSETDACFVFGDEPAVLFLYPATDFATQAASDREAEGEPLEGLGDQALYFPDVRQGNADSVLVQSGDHTFFLFVVGADRPGLLAAAGVVIDLLG